MTSICFLLFQKGMGVFNDAFAVRLLQMAKTLQQQRFWLFVFFFFFRIWMQTQNG